MRSINIGNIKNITVDLSDGIKLLKIIEIIVPGIVDWKLVFMNASDMYKKIENCIVC